MQELHLLPLTECGAKVLLIFDICKRNRIFGRFFVGMLLMSEVTRLRRVLSAVSKLCALRQKTLIGTFGKGIGWGIALPNAHE